MKTLNPIRFALLAAAAIFTHAAFAGKPTPLPPPPPPSSGTLVLDYSGPEGTGAENFGLTVAPSGAVYASGSVMASDAAGNLYVASLAGDYLSSDHFVVRRSTDGGVIWAIVDDFKRGAVTPDIDEPSAITVDAAGDVYYVGRSYVSGVVTWTVRKGVGGTSFSTVDLASGDAMAIYAHPAAGIFAAGSRYISSTGTAWVVRRSTNGGATWSEIDTFQLQSGQLSRALGIGADGAGNLYIIGRGTTKKGSTATGHWLVRKSTDGGATFTTTDDVASSNSSVNEARRIVATSNGDLYVAGVVTLSNVGHWLLRKSAGGGGAWTTVDDFQYGGAWTEPHSIAANASGNLFVGGLGGGRWIVKKY